MNAKQNENNTFKKSQKTNGQTKMGNLLQFMSETRFNPTNIRKSSYNGE